MYNMWRHAPDLVDETQCNVKYSIIIKQVTESSSKSWDTFVVI